jgi:histidinol-phosphate aminotransferase
MDESFALPEALFTSDARLCFIPRPNAPTGIAASRADMERLCRSFKGLVYIDEAYADFADDTCMDLPKQFDNVIVGRTFSKSFSLAGLRVGTATARPELIAELIKTKDSYNLNGVSQAAASAGMDDYAYMRANVERVRTTRTRLIAALRQLGFDVPESQANFVLARWNGTPTARDIFAALRDRAILVRYFDARRLQDALRITVGTEEETDALLRALAEIVEG